MARWSVEFKKSAVGDLEWFSPATARSLVQGMIGRLTNDPVSETRNCKALRSNPIAQRELRLGGKYRILYSIEEARRIVTILVVGEKSGNALLVRGERFEAHESHSAE